MLFPRIQFSLASYEDVQASLLYILFASKMSWEKAKKKECGMSGGCGKNDTKRTNEKNKWATRVEILLPETNWNYKTVMGNCRFIPSLFITSKFPGKYFLSVRSDRLAGLDIGYVCPRRLDRKIDNFTINLNKKRRFSLITMSEI